ncbi:2-phospho-L-lactate guanylyltransferase [Microlunatus elymi]|uniref:2-phospho-L-lactate guanylyltransferase n=1 Tax=Microlunatus elymi TaxID=2596828 RepID=A0A516Q6P8_9ACTN|nr:2-phospho-L-lactate guanylyltransferase [Microlunatus elymi]
MSWGGVVALKPAAVGKSRLGVLPVPLRERLALMMALDSLTAIAAATDRLLVITDDPNLPGILAQEDIDAEVLAEPDGGGLNAALSAGDLALREADCDHVLAAVGDLPALTAESVTAFLAAAAVRAVPGRAFVPDRSGVGTTLLAASGVALNPLFGGQSAAAHRDSGAVPIDDLDLPGLRSDVDAPADLPPAIEVGVGRYTASLVAPQDRDLAEYVPVTVAGPVGDQTDEYAVITDSGVRLRLASAVLDRRIRFLRAGQRLHAVRAGDAVLSAWF